MKEFKYPVQIRWSDLDPNIHLRHSVYYDWGALCRINFLNENGLGTDVLQKLQIGPIIFREECIFKREIRFGDEVTIDLQMVQAKRDFSRWTMRHTIIKNKETIAAIITIDAAWLDVVKRKLTGPPGEAHQPFSIIPLTEDFKWID